MEHCANYLLARTVPTIFLLARCQPFFLAPPVIDLGREKEEGGARKMMERAANLNPKPKPFLASPLIDLALQKERVGGRGGARDKTYTHMHTGRGTRRIAAPMYINTLQHTAPRCNLLQHRVCEGQDGLR